MLADILRKREEVFEIEDDEHNLIVVPQWEALFHGRPDLQNAKAVVGPKETAHQLTISEAQPEKEALAELGKKIFRIPARRCVWFP